MAYSFELKHARRTVYRHVCITCLFSLDLAPSRAQGLGRAVLDVPAAHVLLQLHLGAPALVVLVAGTVRVPEGAAGPLTQAATQGAADGVVTFHSEGWKQRKLPNF